MEFTVFQRGSGTRYVGDHGGKLGGKSRHWQPAARRRGWPPRLAAAACGGGPGVWRGAGAAPDSAIGLR
jgi:hypothetical protein